MSVRLVQLGTNRVIAQMFTDEQGFAHFEMITEAWRVQARADEVQPFFLLLSPGNQPSLIP